MRTILKLACTAAALAALPAPSQSVAPAMREVRARARQSHRWAIAAPFLLVAIAVAWLPGRWRRRQTVAPQPPGILPMD